MAAQRNKPGPLTTEERSVALAALTDDQLADMMAYLSGWAPAVFDEILAIRRPERLPERLRGQTDTMSVSS